MRSQHSVMNIINHPHSSVRQRTTPLPKQMATSNKSMYLRPVSNRSSKSFHRWSISEPVGQSFTDHWAKQKCRYYQHTLMPTGTYIAFCYPEGLPYSSRQRSKSASALLRPSPSFIHKNIATPSGSVAPMGDSKFNQYLVQTLHNPGLVHVPPPKDSRGYSLGRPGVSQYHERAKRGYVYWPKEKNRLPAQLLSTIGSKGTNLGIGSAPRT